MNIYERIIQHPILGPLTYIALWAAMIAIGLAIAKIKNDRGRFKLRTLLLVVTSAAVVCMVLKIWFHVPGK